MENVHIMGSVTPASISLDMEAIHDIAVGTTLLGAGGGGETYLAELQLQQAIENGANIQLMDVADVPVDALVVACGWMGAPTVQKEKYANGSEAELGLEKLEQVMGRRVDAIFPIEIGGQNGLSPLLLAARRGIPVLDCDGMGRAFPEAHMVTFNIYGCSASPAVFTDEKGNCLVMDVEINQEEERLGRQITIAMGGHCHVIDYPMTGQQLKQHAVRGTLSIARGIGHAIRQAKHNNQQDPFKALFNYLVTTGYYQHSRILFDGKIVDLDRSIQDGFSKGKVVLEGGLKQAGCMEVEFQNENLIAHCNGKIVATVPDIIAIMDRETAEAINTENLKYGQRVKVVGISVPPILRTTEALEVVGPGAFGLETDYTPIEILNQNPPELSRE
jgi:uncharacterized protein